MTVLHHPTPDLLTAFAAGTLDHGQHIAAATHLGHCAACRARVRAMEHVGGAMLDSTEPAGLRPDAFARMQARLDQPAPTPAPQPAPGLSDVPGLPDFVRRLPAGAWSWVAPGLHVRRLQLDPSSATRVFLLRSRAGSKFISHAHTGFEMTCVLMGSFSHGGERYAAGDFDLGTPDISHDIEIGDEGPCVSLVAMQGTLKLPGVLGRLFQPFIRF